MILTNIDSTVYNTITEALATNINAKPVIITHLSQHPDDWYLYLYIAERNGKYIAGLANISGETVGLYENHYDCTLKEAMEITASKLM